MAEGYSPNPKAFFLKQTIGNACGTIGLIHAVANNTETLSLGNSAINGVIDLIGEGFLKEYIDVCRDLTPAERGNKLENSKEISVVHDVVAHEGQTEVSHSLTHTHTHTHSLAHSLTHSYTHTSTITHTQHISYAASPFTPSDSLSGAEC